METHHYHNRLAPHMPRSNHSNGFEEPPEHSLVFLLRELRDESTTLMRQEIALAKAEMTEKAKIMGRNLAYIAGGAAIAYAAVILLLLGVRDLLAAGLVAAGASPLLATCLSSFVVAIGIGVGAWALINYGRKALAEETLTPEKTIESLREDKEMIKDKLSPS
jgi:hypothetical protein